MLVQGYGLLVSRLVLGNWLLIDNLLDWVSWLRNIFPSLVIIRLWHLGLLLCL